MNLWHKLFQPGRKEIPAQTSAPATAPEASPEPKPCLAAEPSPRQDAQALPPEPAKPQAPTPATDKEHEPVTALDSKDTPDLNAEASTQSASRPPESEALESPAARARSARQYLKHGQYQEAETLYAELAAQYPEDATGPTGLARCASARKDWQEAVTRWQTCLERFPKQDSAAQWRVELGNVLVQLNRFADAERQFQTALSENDNISGPYEGLAQIALAQGQSQVAIVRFRDCIAVRPHHPKARRWRAKIGGLLLGLGLFDAAECEFMALADQFPDDPVGQKGLEKVARQRQQAAQPTAAPT